MRTGGFAEQREVVRDLLGGRQASTSLDFSCQVSSTRERGREYFHTPRHKTFRRALTSLSTKRGSKSINSFQSSQLSVVKFRILVRAHASTSVRVRAHALEHETGTRGCWKLTHE